MFEDLYKELKEIINDSERLFKEWEELEHEQIRINKEYCDSIKSISK